MATFSGTTGVDIIFGTSGDDTITSGDGNDLLLGGGGKDNSPAEITTTSILGNDGDDTLDGSS